MRIASARGPTGSPAKLPANGDAARAICHSRTIYADRLAESAIASPRVAQERPRALAAILERLPQPEKDLLRRRYAMRLSIEQIAAADARPPSATARDLDILHVTLILALQDASPDSGPASPGGAADLTRLVLQLLNGTISADSRLVLETLLLADAPAQRHYHRCVALAVELEWRYGGAR